MFSAVIKEFNRMNDTMLEKLKQKKFEEEKLKQEKLHLLEEKVSITTKSETIPKATFEDLGIASEHARQELEYFLTEQIKS